MKIGIIDADLLNKTRHRFPNLASMKISGYFKEQGHNVELLLSYDNLDQYDKVYISKVFTDTPVPEDVLKMNNVEYGGTGFFFDKAPNLPYEIEHHFPDYHLYDEFIEKEIERGINPKNFDEFTKYSLGWRTRGCIRKCKFCVNQKYDKVEDHSPLEEFLDPTRPYICLLDDNILAYKDWDKVFTELQNTGKRFKFKQGLDERLLTEEKCKMILNSKYKNAPTFAFDKITDKDIIIKKLDLWRSLDTKKTLTFYVLCGFDKNNKYDEKFWKQDIIDTFERIKILMKYRCLPYIMRFEKYNNSPYRGMYINLARWCNQPTYFKKKSFREFCFMKENKGSTMRYYEEFRRIYPEIDKEYFDLKFEDLKKY